MLAFLFDRRSGTWTGLTLAALAVILFAGGVLVGLNLRWSREEAIDAALHPAEVAGELKARVKARGKAKPAAPEAPSSSAPAEPVAATSPSGGR